MRFDDRLSTVLSMPVGSVHDRIIRWRQLVDLVARSAGAGDHVLVDCAIQDIRADYSHIHDSARAAAVRSIAGMDLPVKLLQLFARDRLSIAAPLFAGVALDQRALLAIRADASPDVLELLEKIYPQAVELKPKAHPKAVESDMPSIGDVVARIERLRGEREATGRAPVNEADEGFVAHVEAEAEEAIERDVVDQESMFDPANGGEDQLVDEVIATSEWPIEESGIRRSSSDENDEPGLFRWESNSLGEIDWVEGAPRGALVGRSLADSAFSGPGCEQVELAVKMRSPFRDCTIDLGTAGAVSGTWTFGGAPVFNSGDGRFVGYRGIAQRSGGGIAQQAPAAGIRRPLGYDALREMIHEIKTPLNAIIGFAEIIDGQYFGPAHRHYRQRASQIVSNARLLLEASDDLDFVARRNSGEGQPRTRVGASDFAAEMAGELTVIAAREGVTLEMANSVSPDFPKELDSELAGRLARRLGNALIRASEHGERLKGQLDATTREIEIAIDLPEVAQSLDGAGLLQPELITSDQNEMLLGPAFSLRLVNGLAGLSGGRLLILDGQATLFLPLDN